VSDFKLKLILSSLAGVVFSFIFILLTFALPVKEKQYTIIKKPQNKLEVISQSFNNK